MSNLIEFMHAGKLVKASLESSSADGEKLYAVSIGKRLIEILSKEDAEGAIHWMEKGKEKVTPLSKELGRLIEEHNRKKQ